MMIDKNWLTLHILYVTLRRRGAPGRERPRDANPTTRVSQRADGLRPLLGLQQRGRGPHHPSEFTQSQKRTVREKKKREKEMETFGGKSNRINSPHMTFPSGPLLPPHRGPRRRPTRATRIQSGCWEADTAHLMHPAHLLLPTPDPTPSHI